MKIFTNLVFDIQKLWANLTAYIQSAGVSAFQAVQDASSDVGTALGLFYVAVTEGNDALLVALEAAEIGDRKKQDDNKAALKSIEDERKAKLKAIGKNRTTADKTRDEQTKKDIKAAQEGTKKAADEFNKLKTSAAATALSG